MKKLDLAKLPEFVNQKCDIDICNYFECHKPVQHLLFCDCLGYLSRFGCGGAVKEGEEEEDRPN